MNFRDTISKGSRLMLATLIPKFQIPTHRRRQKYASLKSLAEDTSDPHFKDFVDAYNDSTNLLIKKILPISNYIPPKYPIVLCHGLSGFDKLILIPSIQTLVKIIRQHLDSNNSENFLNTEDDLQVANVIQINYWIGIKESLESKGCKVLVTRVPSFGSIEERAFALHKLLEKYADKSKGSRMKLNLIAHSMGGLDCRYLISRIPNKKNYQIASLTTISTPHRGSEMADFVVGQFQSIKELLGDKNSSEVLPLCFYQLGTNYMNTFFNLVTPNDPKVKYFSYGCSFHPKWYSILGFSWKILYELSGGKENDGMVTVRSSKWGKYMGTLENVDHLDVINWKNKIQRDLNKVIKQNSKHGIDDLDEEDLDILQFYIQITDVLAKNNL